VKDRRIVASFFGKGFYDRDGFRDDRLRLVSTEFVLQGVPFVQFSDGIKEIDGRIDEKILCDADFTLVVVDDAQISPLQRAETYSHKTDCGNLEIVALPQRRKGFLHDFIQITSVVRSEARRTASARRQRKIPAHRRG